MKRYFKYVICCALCLFCAFSCITFSGCKHVDNLESISKNLTNYEINLNLNSETKQVKASCKIDYINNTESILRHISFHLYPQYFKKGATDLVVSSTKLNVAYPNGLSYAEFEIDRVQVEKTDVEVKIEGEHGGILKVQLPNSLLPGERVCVFVEFSFVLPNCEHRFGYGEKTINLGNFYPVACVWEDGEFLTHPYNSNGDPFYSDMANYIVTISCNKNFVVAGTGEKVDEAITENTKTTTFKADVVRDFAMVLSEYFEVKCAEANKVYVEYYYFNDENSDKALKAGMDAISVFSSKFGRYPYKTFSIVKTDFVHGGMEYPNLVMISSDIDNLDDYLNVIVHETAHQWWYGVVGNNEYIYPWLDEALTEFSTVLFYDYAKGYNLNHKNMVQASHDNYSLFVSVYTDVLGNLNTSMRAVNEYATEPEYTYCTYVKGVLMFESLYNLVGENKFIESLKEYYACNKFKNSTPEQLMLAFENVCKKDLEGFFNSWIEGRVVIR